jgi:GT2 family glycosyltransferase
MPVHDGGEALGLAMDAIRRSDLSPESWELVVVDDGSDDDTALLAAEHADRLVRLPGRPHGPGYARNRGFEVTLGEFVAFVNADVMVRSDTLRRAVAVLAERPEVDAVFGTYDTQPAAKEFVSQYRNLLQHYYHRRNTGYASTFSSACGIMRSAVFDETGGYDEWHFARHQLEDLELGQRMRHLGHRIVLHPDLHSTHLKRWTLPKIIAAEIIDQRVPWMRLRNRPLMPAPKTPRTMRAIKRRNIVLTWLAGALALAAWREGRSALLLGTLACLALLLVNNRSQLAFFRSERGLAFALATIPLDMVCYFVCGLGTVVGWLARQTLGEPRPGPAAEAFSEMSVKRWPPAPVKRELDRYDLTDVRSPPSAPHSGT